jgi:hypothetical protein
MLPDPQRFGSDGGRVTVSRRWLRREVGLALALLLALGALAPAGRSTGGVRRSGLRATSDLAARVPSVGALRTPRARDVAAPGALRDSLAWNFTLLAVTLASFAGARVNRVRLAALLRTRAPPALRFV